MVQPVDNPNIFHLTQALSQLDTSSPTFQQKKDLIELDLKAEALSGRFSKLHLKSFAVALIGAGVALGGIIASGGAIAFTGAALTGTAVLTGGLSLVGLSVIFLLIIAVVYLYKKKQLGNTRSSIELNIKTIKSKFDIPENQLNQHRKVEDTETILNALGISGAVTQDISVSFAKKHGHTIDEFVDAITRSLASVRNQSITKGYGTLRLDNIHKVPKGRLKGEGKWKYVVELDPANQQIKKLTIAKQTARGTSLKVAISLNGNALMIPRKKAGKTATAEKDQKRASKNIKKLHNFYKTFPNYEEIKKYLPPLPQKIASNKLDGRKRRIRIAEEAISAASIFKTEPRNTQEVVKRLKIIRDAAFGVSLMHRAKGYCMVHGDLKPENILVDRNSHIARPHDFGGVVSIEDNDNTYSAFDKLDKITYTPGYTCYEDVMQRVRYLDRAKNVYANVILNKGNVETLGQRGDTYSLGICLMKALIGKKSPFPANQYARTKGGLAFPDGNPDRRTPINCIPKKHPAKKMLDQLLDNVLQKNFKKRMSVEDFVNQLNFIIGELEKT